MTGFFSMTSRRLIKPLIGFMAIVATFAVVFSTIIPAPIANAQKEGTSDKVATAPESTAATFTNSTAITLGTGGPNNGSLYPSPIVVSGQGTSLPTTPGSIKVTLNNVSHTFISDVGFVLVAPNGDALLIQDAAGGEDPISGVTYTLSDDGANVLPEGAWGPGTYKPTSYFLGDSFPAPGPLTAYQNPGPASGGTATFSSTFGGDNPNGTWNLFVRDFVTGDGGSIAGGWTLEINAGPTIVPQHVVDFNGDNKTDYAVVRNTGGGSGGQLTWFINNGTTSSGFAWGISGDEFVPEDYDGDNKTDIAVWRPGAPTVAAFYILQSSTNTLRLELFGQTGDDPSVVGDYDGDNKADIAVYRAVTGGQSTWYYRGSNANPGGNTTFVPWGIAGDFPIPGDFDGDGKNDFVVQRPTSGAGVFWTRTATGAVSTLSFGFSSDSVVPGDYDGDGKTDFAVARASGGAWNWFIRRSTTGSVVGGPFGLSASDFLTQGDYDGDGKTDIAVWRSTEGNFYVLNSGTNTATGVHWGVTGDYPVANYNVH